MYFRLCSGTASVRNLSVADKQKLSTNWLRQNSELLAHISEKSRSRSAWLQVWLGPEVNDVIGAPALFLCSSSALHAPLCSVLCAGLGPSCVPVMVAAMAIVVRDLPCIYCSELRKRKSLLW